MIKENLSEILLIEDNPGDIGLAIEAFKEAGIGNPLNIVRNGTEALDYLKRARPDAAGPGLILLDLNLPGMGGLEVLSAIKSDPALRKIPVVVLTTSSNKNDIEASYSLQANCFITKPFNFALFVEMIEGIHRFWFGVAKPAAGGDD